MKRIVMLPVLCVAFAFTAGTYPTEKELIEKLSDRSQAVRDEAAKELASRVGAGITELGPGNIAAHDSAYWASLIAKTNMRGNLNEVVRALAIDSTSQELGMCDGQSCFNTYRLDNSFVLQLYFNANPPYAVNFDTLFYQPKRVYVGEPTGFTGEWRTYYVNGQLSHRVMYQNGIYHGTFVSYHPNGDTAYIQHYAKGIANGEDRGYYPSGKLMYSGNYTNGKQDGTWTHYWENGKVRTVQNFVAGEHHGKDVEYYEDGKIYTETWYENGKQTRHRAFNRKGDCTFDSKNTK